MGKIVNPNIKQSIDKKDKILQVAYEIFKYKGYINTSISEIAKEAGVSIGCIHSNFKDKKDILLACIFKVDSELTERMCDEISEISASTDTFSIAKKIIQIIVELHSGDRIYHYDVISLRYNDQDISRYFKEVEDSMVSAISSKLKKNGLAFRNEREQTFLLFSLIRGIEDELFFKLDPSIDKEILIDECARIISSMIITVNI